MLLSSKILWSEVVSGCVDALKVGSILAAIFAYAMLAYCWIADQVVLPVGFPPLLSNSSVKLIAEFSLIVGAFGTASMLLVFATLGVCAYVLKHRVAAQVRSAGRA